MAKTSPSRVGFVKSSGVSCTVTTRPVGMRASSTSVLHIACQEKTITQTCGSLARQFYPVINNGIVVAQVEVGVVCHVQHCRFGRHRSYPEHFRNRMCSTCPYTDFKSRVASPRVYVTETRTSPGKPWSPSGDIRLRVKV